MIQVEADLFDQGLDIITPRCVFLMKSVGLVLRWLVEAMDRARG